MVLHPDCLQSLPNLFLRTGLKGVNVAGNGRPEEEGALWDHGDILSQGMQSHSKHILAPNAINGSLFWLIDP